MPMILTRRPAGPRMAERLEYLFPRYLFIPVVDVWHCLLGTFGISGLIMDGEHPAYVSHAEVENIKARCEFDSLKAVWVYKTNKDRFARNQAVRIKGGKFALSEAVYLGMTARDRVAVLINMLGQSVRVDLDESNLVAA